MATETVIYEDDNLKVSKFDAYQGQPAYYSFIVKTHNSIGDLQATLPAP